MNLLFLGGNFSEEMEKDILRESKGTVHYAANKLQWNLIEGLAAIPDIEMEILSAPFIGTFPKEYKKLYIKERSEIHKNIVESNYVSFWNLWGYRNISRKKSLRKKMQDFIAKKSDKKVILVYSPHTPFLQAAVSAKLKDPSIHICLVVPDLPQYMNLTDNVSIAYKLFKRIDIKVLQNNLKYVDSFVLLTEPMKEAMKVADRPYIVMEGMVRFSDVEKNNSKIEENIENTIVYTGTLHKKFGVLNLVKAFSEIKDPHISLKICGKGDAEPQILEYAMKDSRIHFMGQISNNQSQIMQKNAAVLVNPRQDNEEYTKYSFPSKNLEYLLSGVPVIAYRLSGIPKEYEDYINYVEDNSIKSLKEKIEEYLYKDKKDRRTIGNKAKKFVIEQKNNIQQSKKIIDMINRSM